MSDDDIDEEGGPPSGLAEDPEEAPMGPEATDPGGKGEGETDMPGIPTEGDPPSGG
jgi:hypothetical protein